MLNSLYPELSDYSVILHQACSLVLNFSEPLFAIVPRLFSRSSSLIPIPLSLIVSVLAVLSVWISLCKIVLESPTLSLGKRLEIQLVIASLALDINSLNQYFPMYISNVSSFPEVFWLCFEIPFVAHKSISWILFLFLAPWLSEC